MSYKLGLTKFWSLVTYSPHDRPNGIMMPSKVPAGHIEQLRGIFKYAEHPICPWSQVQTSIIYLSKKPSMRKEEVKEWTSE